MLGQRHSRYKPLDSRTCTKHASLGNRLGLVANVRAKRFEARFLSRASKCFIELALADQRDGLSLFAFSVTFGGNEVIVRSNGISAPAVSAAG